jgi:uncharacterized membrane protein
MESTREQDKIAGLSKGRMEALTDGIFAFSMTLLVISLNIPDKAVQVQSTGYVLDLLGSLQGDFLHYIIAFLTLGSFWLAHHVQYHHIRSVDWRFTWLGLFALLFVALLPFSTNLSGDFSEVPLAAMVFEANMFAIGLFMFLQWVYATSGHRLVDPDLEPSYIHQSRMRALVIPGVSVLAMLLALSGSTWSTAAFLLLPVVFMGVKKLSLRYKDDD